MREMQELVPGTKREEFVLASSKKLCGNKQSKHLNLEQQSQVRSAKMGYIHSQDISEIKHDCSSDFHQKLGKQNLMCPVFPKCIKPSSRAVGYGI